MALHEANQARSSHYLQWHCGPKLHLLATNDILHLLGKHSTTWPQRAHHHLSGQRSAVLPRYRLVPCKQLSRLRNNQRRVLGWDTSSAREAPWILQRVVDVQCNLQAMLERCHFFEANVNPQVLRLQISFLFHFALQQVSKVGALQHTSILQHTKKGKPTPAATAAQTRYLSSSPAATLHGKTQGFVLRLPPQNIAHATSCSHYNAVRSINLQTCTYLRTEQHQNTRWQESCSHSNAICKHRFQNTLYLRTHKHTQSSLKPPLQCGKKKRQTDPSRNRRTDEVPFIVACSHFTRKNTRFRAPASSPKHSPCNIMQPLQCGSQHQLANLHLSTHRTTPEHQNTRWQESCSHSNAICKHRFKTPYNYAHTQAHPKQLEATVTMRQKKKANRPQPQPPHRRGTFHRRLQPHYTEKRKVSCSGFLPKT